MSALFGLGKAIHESHEPDAGATLFRVFSWIVSLYHLNSQDFIPVICRTTLRRSSYGEFGPDEGATKCRKQQKTDRTQRGTRQLSVGEKCTCRTWKKPRANTGAKSMPAHPAPTKTYK